MERQIRNKTLFGCFAALIVVTLGTKLVAHRVGMIAPAERVSAALQATLQRQGFTTKTVNNEGLSPTILAERGSCRLAVLDGADAGWQSTLFARAAGRVGPVRYLYKRRVYPKPPNLQMLADHLEQRLLTDVGLRLQQHINVALATSPGCGGGDFQLGDLEVEET